jgi:hypothetical protein
MLDLDHRQRVGKPFLAEIAVLVLLQNSNETTANSICCTEPRPHILWLPEILQQSPRDREAAALALAPAARGELAGRRDLREGPWQVFLPLPSRRPAAIDEIPASRNSLTNRSCNVPTP